MKIFILHVLIVFFILLPIQAQNNKALTENYFGETPPGNTPKIFAEGVLNKYSMLHGKLIFTPDGKEVYWENNAAPVQSRWKMKCDVSGKWESGEPSFLDSKYKEGGLTFSYDGQFAFYHSRKPSTGTIKTDKNIWYRIKTLAGWGEAKLLEVGINSTEYDESYFTMAKDATIYFCREEKDIHTHSSGSNNRKKKKTQNDIFMCKLIDGRYEKPQKLGTMINSDKYHEINCVVSPDNDYLIFNSNRPSNYNGFVGLFVSFKTPEGGWTEAVCLDPFLKTNNCMFPSITSDGKYLFFCGGLPENGRYSNSHYYWLLTELIKNMNPGLSQKLKSANPSKNIKKNFQEMIGTVFAPGIVSTQYDELNGVPVTSGKEFYFSRRGIPGKESAIMVSKLKNGQWTAPENVGFDEQFSAIDLFITQDEQQMIFCSNRPRNEGGSKRPDHDFWISHKKDGKWQLPTLFAKKALSDTEDYFPILTKSGNLYFNSQREGDGTNNIYCSRLINGEYQPAEKLPVPINSPFREYDAYVSPEEDMIVFASERPGGLGGSDLYISFYKTNGSWTKPENLGKNINSKGWEYGPRPSPDGKLLYYTSTKDGNENIYWINTDILVSLESKIRSYHE